MSHYVTCRLCGERFDTQKHPFVLLNNLRYAHKECAEKYEANISQDEKDLKELEQYIKQLFGESYINARIRKQIRDYRRDYNYTYSGILKTLKYWYEIKKNPVSSANGSIGIVPYAWQQAKDYYYRLFMANNLNIGKNFEDFKPKKKIIKIPPPKPRQKKIKLFNLGDGEDE